MNTPWNSLRIFQLRGIVISYIMKKVVLAITKAVLNIETKMSIYVSNANFIYATRMRNSMIIIPKTIFKSHRKLWTKRAKSKSWKKSNNNNHSKHIHLYLNSLAKITVLVNFHPHKLLLQHDDGKWYCDSLTSNKKCQRKQSESTIQWPYKRYQCVEGCDFCVCDWCAYKYQINEE